MTEFPQQVCSRCGSKLIQLKKKVEKTATQQSLITTITYRCSNKTCQEEIDKKTAELLQRRKEQEALAEQRLKAQAEQKAANAVAKAQQH